MLITHDKNWEWKGTKNEGWQAPCTDCSDFSENWIATSKLVLELSVIQRYSLKNCLLRDKSLDLWNLQSYIFEQTGSLSTDGAWYNLRIWFIWNVVSEKQLLGSNDRSSYVVMKFGSRSFTFCQTKASTGELLFR